MAMVCYMCEWEGKGVVSWGNWVCESPMASGLGLLLVLGRCEGLCGIGGARVSPEEKGRFHSSLTTCTVKSLSWLERHAVTFDKIS